MPIDTLHVWLNGHDATPIDLPQESRVSYHVEPTNPGPWVRYRSANNLDDRAVFLTLDDDLQYPPDYVERGVHELARLGESSMVCFSGIRWDPVAPRFTYPSDRWQCAADEPLDCARRVALHFGQTSLFWAKAVKGAINFAADGFRTNDDMMIGYQLQRRGVQIICCPKPARWLQDTEFSFQEHALHKRDKATRHRTLRALVERLGFDPTADRLREILTKPKRILILSDLCPPLPGSQKLEARLRALAAADASVHLLATVRHSQIGIVQHYANVPYDVHIAAVPDPGGRLDSVAPVRKWRDWRIRRAGAASLSMMHARCFAVLRPTEVYRDCEGSLLPVLETPTFGVVEPTMAAHE